VRHPAWARGAEDGADGRPAGQSESGGDGAFAAPAGSGPGVLTQRSAVADSRQNISLVRLTQLKPCATSAVGCGRYGGLAAKGLHHVTQRPATTRQWQLLQPHGARRETRAGPGRSSAQQVSILGPRLHCRILLYRIKHACGACTRSGRRFAPSSSVPLPISHTCYGGGPLAHWLQSDV